MKNLFVREQKFYKIGSDFMLKVRNILAQYDESDILESEKTYRKENILDNDHIFKDDDQLTQLAEQAKTSKEFLRLAEQNRLLAALDALIEKSVFNDPDLFQFHWEGLCECLTEKMQEYNPDGYWSCAAKNFGWRNLNGFKVLEAQDGQTLLKEILPKTDCTFYIHRYGYKGFAIQNYHHDSPVGNEWYYIRKIPEQKYYDLQN